MGEMGAEQILCIVGEEHIFATGSEDDGEVGNEPVEGELGASERRRSM